MKICAIHQPNFFPWAGYFDKIRQADIFIFLDQVAYPKSGSGSGSWCNRVKLLKEGIPAWYGLSIKRESGIQPIDQIQFSNKEYELKKIEKTLELNYKKKPYYQEIIPKILPLLHYPSNSLADYNINAITQISSWLGFNTQFIRQSELAHTKHSTELLIELTHQVGADTYLCGNGATGYQNDELFMQAGIYVKYQDTNPAINLFKNVKKEDATLSMVHLLFNHYIDREAQT